MRARPISFAIPEEHVVNAVPAKWTLVQRCYPRARIAVVDGMDAIDWRLSDRAVARYARYATYFRRELSVATGTPRPSA